MDDINYIEWRYLSYGKKKGAVKIASLIKKYSLNIGAVFDIGCAAGGLAYYLPDRKYVGLELEYNNLKKSIKSHPDNSVFICSDAAHLPIKTNSIGSFVSCCMLEHSQDPASLIKEIYRASNGKGIFVLPCRDTIPFIYDPINYLRIKMCRTPFKSGAFGYGHVSLFDREHWQSLLCTAGFKIEGITDYDNSFFSQVEFFIFSLFCPCDHYSELPVRMASKKIYNIFDCFHKLMSLFDIKTTKSFCKCFIVSK